MGEALSKRIADGYEPREVYGRHNLPKRIGDVLDITTCDGQKKVVQPELLLEKQGVKEVYVESGFDYVGRKAFASSSVQKLVLGEGLLGIDSMACYDAADLTEVVLPDSLKYIGSEAFTQCVSLEMIILPPNIEAVGKDIFKKCPSLRLVCCGKKLADEKFSEWKRNGVDLTRIYIIDEDYAISGVYKVKGYNPNYPTLDKNFTRVEKEVAAKLAERRENVHSLTKQPKANTDDLVL